MDEGLRKKNYKKGRSDHRPFFIIF